MEKILSNLKTVFTWIIAIVIILLIFIPFVMMFFYLQKQGKTIVLYPKIKIVEVKNPSNKINKETLEDAVKIGEDFLERIKK